MKKLYRGRLLLTTCLSGAALAWGTGAQAQEADANWKPRAEVDARASDNSSQVSLEMFAPVAQNDSNLLFVSGRIGTDERYDRNGSVTIGGRGKVSDDVAIGVNAGVDFYNSDLTSRAQTAVSFGLEGFTSVFDVRVNYRLPLSNRSTIGFLDPNATASGVLAVENNRLIERKTGWRLEDVPLAGVNAEAGARAPIAKKLSVRASAAGFDYRDDVASQSYRGIRGGLELDVEDPLGSGGRFSLGAALQNDNRWGTQARGTVRLSIPIGRGARDRSSGTTGLDRQMGERIRRDYVAPSGTHYSDLTSTNLAIDARTGQAFGGIYYTSGAATAAGAGTSASPTTLGDAIGKAGQNGVVVALGNGGTISTSGVTLATNQYLVGGASSVDVRRSDGSITAFGFGGTNGTIAGTNAGGAAINLGQGSVVRDMTVRSAGTGIAANGVGGFALDRVVIENTGAAGLALTNTTGSVLIDGVTIRGGAGAGVLINGGSNIMLRNSVIGGGAGAIDINDAGANLTATLANLTLSATGGTVLDIDGSGAGTVTVAGLSGIAIAGGNGETGGFAARYVTFDAAADAGIQTVNAGRMQLGTASARVGGAGVSLTEVDGALSFADLDIANTGGTGLGVNNSKTGTFTLTTLDGSVDTVGAAALNLDPLFLNLTLASVTSTGSNGAGVVLDNVQGAGAGGLALRIGALNITNSALQGLLITGGSTGLVSIGGGTISNSGGAAVQVGEAGVAGSGGTIGLDFGASITDMGAGPLVSIFNSGGAIRFGGAISGAGPITIDGTLAGSSVGFLGAVTITGSTSPAVSLDNLAGQVGFVGPLSIVNPATSAIVIGSVPGGVSFGDVDVTGLSSGSGLDLTRAQGNVSFATLDISGTGAAGTTGIDLSGATNSGAVVISGSSTIQGVDTGVNLDNAAITGSFRYGTGNSGDGLQSRISANTVISIAGLDTTRGTYDFADVDLDGGTNNLTGGSFTAYYVLDGATGAGTSSDFGSLAGAAASGAQYIVLLNDATGGRDVIDTASIGGTLNLGTGQSLVSFLYSDFFSVTGATVPANLIVSNLGPTGISNPFAGSGSAILTSSIGGATVNLANDARIDGVTIDNSAVGGVGVVGNGVSNVVIQNSNVSGNGGAIAITDAGAASSATLSNLDLSASTGTALVLNGGGAGTLNVSASDINIAATGSAAGARLNDVTVGAIGINSITTATSGGTALQLDGLTGGTISIGSVNVGGTGAGPALSIGNNAATVNIGAVTVTGSAGDAVQVSGNTGTVSLGTLTLTNAGGNGLSVTGNAGTVNVAGGTITGAANNGVRIDGVSGAGNVTIGSLGVSGSAVAGITLADIDGSVAFTGTTSIANSTGIVLGAGSNGTIGFGDVDITGLGAGQTGVDARAASGTISFATLDISGASTSGTRGIDLTDATFAGSISTTGSGTITGVGTGVDLTNAAITGSFRFGDGTSANGAGSTIDATTPLAVLGLNAATGTYDFADVNLIGDTTALASSATVYWVAAGAGGAGTRNDPGSLAGAQASGADYVVLVNNPAGGADTIDANDAVFGSGGTFTLAAGQQLRGFLNGDTIALPGGAPSNLILYNIAAGQITNPFAGSGAPTLTTSAGGGADTVRVTGNNLIDGVVIANGGTGTGVFGSGASNVTIRNSIISGADSAIDFSSGGVAASVALSNLRLWASNGSIVLAAYRSGGGSTTVTQLSNIAIEGGHGELGGASFSGATFDADLVTAGYQTVDASLQVGSAAARVAGYGIEFGSAIGALNFTSLGIYNQGAEGLHVVGSGVRVSSAAGTIDTINGDSLSLGSASTDLVLDRIVHSGTGTGVEIMGLTGIGTAGRALRVGTLSVASASGNGILIGSNVNGTVSFGAASSIAGTTGSAISLASGTGTLDFSYDGSVTQSSNAALLDVAGHNGTITFGAGSNLSAINGTGLRFSNADGTYAFNGTTMLNGGNAGISILGGSAGSFTFGANTTITSPASPAFAITSSTANVAYLGTLTQSTAGSLALAVSTHSGGTLDFSNATLNLTGNLGLAFFDADGVYMFGAVTLSGGGGISFAGGSSGTFTFGDVDITGLTANTTAVNLTGATGNVSFASLDITGDSGVGSKGIDLSGNTGAGDILITGTSHISGVDIGVDLTNAAMTGNFRFGDGTSTNGAGSSISATTPLVITGLNGAVGTYNFADVNLTGDTSALSVSAYYVRSGATGAGTRNDPGSLAGAEAAGATYIVLLNDPTGGTDVLDAISAGGSFDLDGGQSLLSFRDVDSFTVSGGAPGNVTLYNVQSGLISNPFAGSGAPTLTTSGGGATVILGGSNLIDGVVIANAGSGAGVLGNGIAGTNIIRNSTISGGAAGAIRIFDGAANTVLALNNLTLFANGGNILNLDGTGAGTLTVSAFSNLRAIHGAETGGFVISDVAFDADPTLTAGFQSVAAGALTLGTTAARIAGTALSLTNVTGKLSFGDLNIANAGGTGLIVANSKTNDFTLGTTGGAIDTTGGTAINLDPLTVNMTLDSVTATGGTYGILLDQVLGSFAVNGAVTLGIASGGALVISDNSALDVDFRGAVAINNSGGAGVSLTNNAGSTIDFTGGLGIVTTTGAGFAATGGGTISVTGTSNSIGTTTGTALNLNGITVAAGGLNFANLSTVGAATGIALTSVISTGGGEIALGAVNLQGVTSRGIDITTALGAPLTIQDLDIGLSNSSAVAFDLNGAALTSGIMVGDFDVTNSAAAGTSIAVDLRGATGGAAVRLGAPSAAGASSSIAGVGTGIYLNAATNLAFTFGDGEAVGDAGSSISAATAIDATAAPATGTYDFRDVTFLGSPGAGFGVNRIYFVDADGSVGGGNGSGVDADNPMTLAAAELAATAQDIIVLINNGSVISAASSNGNDSLILASNMQVRGFGDGVGGGAGSGSAPITVALTVPSTILLSGGTSLSIDDPTGNGAATLTSAAGSNVITLGASGNHLSGFILDGLSTANRGIKDNGAGATNTLIDYMTIRNFVTRGIEITPSTNTTVDHVAFASNLSDLFFSTAANSVITNVTSTGATGTAMTLVTTTGTTTLTNVNIIGASAGILFSVPGGTINATNVDIGVTNGAGLTIGGGTGTFNFDSTSSISQAGAGAALSVSGGHSTGTLAYAGTIVASNGSGLQFDNADGTYNFTGTTVLNGGDAGIDILGSGGIFSFGTGTSIISPTGTAFNVSGSTAAITYSGSITQANNAALLNVLNHSFGIVGFQTGTLSATNGTGLQFDNADGTYNFTGTTTLNGGDAGIDIVNGSGGTFSFGTGTSITHAAAGDAFSLSYSNAGLTYSGSISDSNGYAVRIYNRGAGTVTFNTGTILSSGANARGIGVSYSTSGAVNFNGQTTLSTQANAALVLSDNLGGTVSFGPGVGQNLDITTTSGTGLSIYNGGTVNVLGSSNTIVTGSGTLLDISNSGASALNLNFASASNTLGTYGILVNDFGGTLSGSVNIAGGAITATTSGIRLTGGKLQLNYGGSITTSGTAARSVDVVMISGGGMTLSGDITDTGAGINIAANSGGVLNFTGQNIALSPAGNGRAVTMSGNTGMTVNFAPVAGGNGLDIVTTGSGGGIDFTGGGTLTVTGSGNSIQTATGMILHLMNGSVGSLGLNFDSLTTTGSTNNAINIMNVDGTGTLSANTVSIAGTAGATADGIYYGDGSTMNVNLGTVTIANTGDEGIEINGAGNGTFTAGSVTINNTGGNGVEINGSTNSVSLNGGAIGGTNDPTGFGVYVLNGSGAVSIASSITKTTGNSVVFVDNHETGNVTFSGNISATGGFNSGIVVQNVNSGTVSFLGNTTLSTGANTAVNLLNNTGGTISFPNGGLVITTTGGTGFSATGGGTITTAGSGNTITSTTGTALNVASTTIGSAGLRFQSISSNGASSGIVLSNTGTAGGINVTGTGAAGSGGTIQNSVGDGISLTSTENVRLAYMNVTNNLGDGIGGSNINGFLIDNMLISGNGNDTGTDESGINISELTGTASNGARPTGIFNSTIQNNHEFEVQITNSTGTLTNFQVINSTLSYTGANAASSHGNLINFLGTGTSSMGISVSGSNFTGNWNAASPPILVTGSGLFADSTGTSMTVQVNGSTFTNNNNGINVSTGPGSTTLTYNIDGNTFTGTRSTAINDFQNGNAPFGRAVYGRITNNIIGNNAVTNSGSNVGNGISIANEGGVNGNYYISGNTIQQIQTSQGIVVNVGLVGQATGNGTTNVTITNNTIRNINGSRGLVINNNQNTGGFPTVNVSMTGNTFSGIAGQAGNGQYLRLSASGGGTINVTQGQATASAIASELDDANGFNDTTKISIGTGTFNYGQPAPTLPAASVPLP